MTKPTSKTRRKRAPNKINSTPAIQTLYTYFVEPFFDRYTLHHEQTKFKEGIQAFFGYPERRVVWCRAKESFTLPGGMWSDTSRPHILEFGSGRRYVKKGDGVVVRVEQGRPDYNEVEHDEQVFVLTDAQLAHINQFLVIRA